MKKKDVFISIIGKQTTNDDSETSELYTNGTFYKQNDCYYISYDETEASGFEGSRTVVKVSGSDKVIMMRSGSASSHLIMENNRRCVGQYGVDKGQLFIGVTTEEISNQLTEDGGKLYFRYQLDLNAKNISTNEVFITVQDR
ncbi:MAG: DUF1934 domain-containing protein [Clostridiales bacterium]|nr:DUF1934 domain-containing protein [Clostridiales bacterium]